MTIYEMGDIVSTLDETRPRLAVYPNPVKDRLHLLLTERQGNASGVLISNQLGQRVMEIALTGSEPILALDVSDLDKGTYIISLVDGDTPVATTTLR